jgi:hypothetical protein
MNLDLDRVLQRNPLLGDERDTQAIALLRAVIGCFGESWWRKQRDARLAMLYQEIVELLDQRIGLKRL